MFLRSFANRCISLVSREFSFQMTSCRLSWGLGSSAAPPPSLSFGGCQRDSPIRIFSAGIQWVLCSAKCISALGDVQTQSRSKIHLGLPLLSKLFCWQGLVVWRVRAKQTLKDCFLVLMVSSLLCDESPGRDLSFLWPLLSERDNLFLSIAFLNHSDEGESVSAGVVAQCMQWVPLGARLWRSSCTAVKVATTER